MASQNINVGTNADDGTGESLRSAFIDIRKMFAEVYGQTYTSDTQDLGGATFEIDSDQIVDGAIDEVHLNATNSPSANQILQWDGSTGFTWVDQFDGDITSVVAGDGLTGGATDGDATLNVNVDDSTVEVATDTVQVKDLGIATGKIANDAVTHDKLEGRYTSIPADITTTTGTINLDASSHAAFNLTGNLGTVTLNIQSIKTGQAIDILLSGSDLSSAVITLADDFTTSAINQVGTVNIDTSKTNMIQVVCIDDTDSDAIINYAVAEYTADDQPNA